MSQRSISLKQLVPGYAGIPELEVTGVALDSRKVVPGGLFMAIPGSVVDGRDYIPQAIEKGAAAILCEADAVSCEQREGVTICGVPGLAARIGEIAARFYGKPTESIYLVGVTGTNGKSTCAYLATQLLAAHFGSAGLMGTIGNGVWRDGDIDLVETGLTTPDPVRLQEEYATFHEQGVRAAAMEVSSHSLDQGRVHGLTFDTAIFTNLSRDHLDYHGTMAAYGSAKEKLFGLPKMRFGVINVDDPFGAQLAERVKLRGLKVITYGLQGGDVRATELRRLEQGFVVKLTTPWGEGELHAALMGDFNIHNALAVVAAAKCAGMPFEKILEVFPSLRAVPGRMERVESDAGDDDISVLVDYAHTPDALRAALAAVRPYCRGRLWCVFGCGGDRDSGKRAPMGRIASEMADVAVVTSDNPRTEDPQAIIRDVLEGAADSARVEPDRAKAIAMAVSEAAPGDIVLIAGKGHEDYQIIGKERMHFCDREHAEEQLVLRATGKAQGAGGAA